jgi:hypothetical protein
MSLRPKLRLPLVSKRKLYSTLMLNLLNNYLLLYNTDARAGCRQRRSANG